MAVMTMITYANGKSICPLTLLSVGGSWSQGRGTWRTSPNKHIANVIVIIHSPSLPGGCLSVSGGDQCGGCAC